MSRFLTFTHLRIGVLSTVEVFLAGSGDRVRNTGRGLSRRIGMVN